MNRLLLVAALLCNIATAADIPVSSARDDRVQHVVYNTDGVVPVALDADSRVTRVEFEKGEVVMNYFGGFPEGYEITVAYNTVIIRPLELQQGSEWVKPNTDWNTNLTITTNKRIYILDLKIKARPAYLVRFTYPTEQEQARLAAVEEKAAAQIKAQPEPIDIKNFDYTARLGKGTRSQTIVPEATYNNGAHTFLEFAPHADMPIVFTGSGDEEVMANSGVEDVRPNTIRVTTIARELTLRLTKGNTRKVVTITNHAFGAEQ